MLGDIDRQQSSREWLKRCGPLNCRALILGRSATDNIAASAERHQSHVVLDTPAGLHGKMLDKVLKLSIAGDRAGAAVRCSTCWRRDNFFTEALLEEKAVRKGKADVAVIGMRVDARTRAAGELERFFATFELPVLAYLRDTQVYVQATAAGMTIFDLPPSRAERDLEQWRAIIDWVEAD